LLVVKKKKKKMTKRKDPEKGKNPRFAALGQPGGKRKKKKVKEKKQFSFQFRKRGKNPQRGTAAPRT